MNEFFGHILNWLSINWPSITAVIGIFVDLIITLRQRHKIKDNILSIDKLSSAVTANNGMSEIVVKADKSIQKAVDEMGQLKDKYDELSKQVVDANEKMDAILEVLQIAYSQLKGDNIRNSINNIINNVKFTANSERAKLEKELKELKEKFKAMAEETEQRVNEIVTDDVPKLPDTVTTETNITVRY